ncbi:hypothetical protein QBC46DRAFT_400740 [Diplogelasinospora grovesii]|uniref:Uncharacterized protein n=1 Tax=Diplogelasinospora grovesii TaxID=303347 RepID=A0AAN6MVF9_9PEZI|nr:hypothetical protein QBC46DRAFT_400740 [Diplogelasinospora grovesii]
MQYSANQMGLPFLAVTGAHGWPTTLGRLRCGIQINMRGMNDTKVNKDGNTATVGGRGRDAIRGCAISVCAQIGHTGTSAKTVDFAAKILLRQDALVNVPQ